MDQRVVKRGNDGEIVGDQEVMSHAAKYRKGGKVQKGLSHSTKQSQSFM
jgi:hypothetical protein